MKTLSIGMGIEGQIRANVTIEFLPVVQLGFDTDRTPASRELYIQQVNNRLAAVARYIQRSLEELTLEELESRVREQTQSTNHVKE